MKGNQKRKASGYIHVIPLSKPALDILQTLSPLSLHREHVFPSIKNPKAPMNSQTANAAIKRMGYQNMLVISIVLE
jgi:integrase